MLSSRHMKPKKSVNFQVSLFNVSFQLIDDESAASFKEKVIVNNFRKARLRS